MNSRSTIYLLVLVALTLMVPPSHAQDIPGPINGCADVDFDGVCWLLDNCPETYNPPVFVGEGSAQPDRDGDGLGDVCDPCPDYYYNDEDNDGICGDIDPCRTDPYNDQDKDGICANFDICPTDPFNDADKDGLCGDVDNCPTLANANQLDSDGDGVGDACDPCPNDPNNDVDQDGVCGDVDNCPTVPNPDQKDYDEDGLGNLCDLCGSDPSNDIDKDGICANLDNCPTVANVSQLDSDADGVGDVCDPCPNDPSNDADNDGVCGDVDNCPAVANPIGTRPGQSDEDGDGLGNACDPCPADSNNDTDKDGVCGDVDNCPLVANGNQSNQDGDAFGDACDACPNDANNDQDGDGFCGNVDNCPTIANADQADDDNDGQGNACEACNDSDNDGICAANDNCPNHPNPTQDDFDSDGQGDHCDCDDGIIGPNEIAVDCDWQRMDWWEVPPPSLMCGECKSAILVDGGFASSFSAMPVVYSGTTKGMIDIVFIMSDSYNGDWYRFSLDVQNAINDYFTNPTLLGGRALFNFWILPFSIATIVGNDPNVLCEWQYIPAWSVGATHADIAVVLHLNNCRNFRRGSTCDVEPGNARLLVHESGHALFDLADEYDDSPDCVPAYGQREPAEFSNIFATREDCGTYTSYPPANCRNFTSCSSFAALLGWWTAQPAFTVMADNVVITLPGAWGDDAKRRIDWIFSQYWVTRNTASASREIRAQDDRKAILVKLRLAESGITVLGQGIVFGDTPEGYAEFQGLEIESLDSAGNRLHRFRIMDPRYIDYVNPPGGDFLAETEFTLRIPFRQNINRIRISDVRTGAFLGEVDLSATVRSFCESQPEDKECADWLGRSNCSRLNLSSFTVHAPCLDLSAQSTYWYALQLSPDSWSLPGFGENGSGVFPATPDCSTFDVLTSTLHIPCLDLGAPVTYWFDLLLNSNGWALQNWGENSVGQGTLGDK